MTSRRHFLAAAAGVLPASRALAQALARPARLVVGFPPGGSSDVVARLLVEPLREYAAGIVVDNRAGAGGRIGLEHLKNAEPDGTVMGLTPASMLVLYPHVFRKLAYDPLADFVPVGTICTFAFTYNIGPLVPEGVRTLAEFFAWCRANPGLASYGSSGTGTVPHLLAAQLARAAGVPMTHVPYKGGAPAIQDVVGGQIAANIGVTSTAIPHVRAGKLRALATTGLRRQVALPEVPTLREAGFDRMQAEEWFGMLLPARTPRETATRLNASLRRALERAEVREALAKLGFEPGGDSTDEFAAKLKAEYEQWAVVVKEVGFTPED